MEIKNKLYPYPVLADYLDDYNNCSFDSEIAVSREGYNIVIGFSAELTSATITDLISEGSAKYVYHIECAQTGFRTVYSTCDLNSAYKISDKKINGKLQICPFIVASKDIENYTSEELHEDYDGETFNIESGCVMAVGNMVTADIIKDTDDLANTPSVFSIVRNADTECGQMLVDYSGRKIVIKLPLNDYYSYKTLSNNPIAQPMLNSLTVIPALTFVLSELKLLSIEERRENSDSLWYKTIRKALSTKFNCDIESEDYINENTIELAQKLINDPITDAFNLLTNSFNSTGGDEE